MSNKNLSNITNLIQSPSPSSPQTAGMIVPFAGASAPTGWAICDGSILTIASYDQLYGRIGTAWNTCTNPLTGVAYNSGITAGVNFRIPDLRGTFLRGIGDFTDNTKDTILAGFQSSQNLLHGHSISVASGGTNSGYNRPFGGNVGTFTNITIPPSTDGINEVGSSESRPQNVGVNYLIKLYDDAGSIVMSGSPFVGSEFQPAPITITGNNTLAISKFYTIESASASTQTLPAATGINAVITVENTGTGLVTVDGNASETINGSLNQVIGQYASLKVRDYAAGKWIVMH